MGKAILIRVPDRDRQGKFTRLIVDCEHATTEAILLEGEEDTILPMILAAMHLTHQETCSCWIAVHE